MQIKLPKYRGFDFKQCTSDDVLITSKLYYTEEPDPLPVPKSTPFLSSDLQSGLELPLFTGTPILEAPSQLQTCVKALILKPIKPTTSCEIEFLTKRDLLMPRLETKLDEPAKFRMVDSSDCLFVKVPFSQSLKLQVDSGAQVKVTLRKMLQARTVVKCEDPTAMSL